MTWSNIVEFINLCVKKTSAKKYNKILILAISRFVSIYFSELSNKFYSENVLLLHSEEEKRCLKKLSTWFCW